VYLYFCSGPLLTYNFCLQSDSYFDKELESVTDTAANHGLTVQPFPPLVGDSVNQIENSYVVIDTSPILMDSPLRALEVTFKCYFALHCKYPTQSESQWIVLQKTLFDLYVPANRVNPIANVWEVKKLIKSLSC